MSKTKGFFNILDAHFFSYAYKALSQGKVVEFKPKIKQETGITYDFFGIEVPEERLQYYRERGFLEVSDEISLPVCPICGEVCLHPLLLCPKCGSMNIEKKELMAHYDCGYIGPVEEFETREPGVYRCPKCKKTMNRVGIDYGRPGFGFTCKKCGSVFQVPLIEVECQKGHRNKIQTLDMEKYPVYRISPEVKKFAAIYYAIEELRKGLASLGVESEPFARIKGLSGITHTAPLYVNAKPAVIVDIVTEDFLDEKYLLGVAVKAVDLSDTITLLVLPRNVKSDFEKIFNPEKVKVFKVEDLMNSMDQIVNEILTLIGARLHEKT